MKSQTAITWTMGLAMVVVICLSTAEPAAVQQAAQADLDTAVGVTPESMLALCRAALGPTATMFTREHGGLACETPEMRATAVAEASPP